MNQLIPCPSCHQLLQPPEKASKHAKLRCPLCQKEILACDLLMGIHRPWTVIDDPGGSDAFHEFRSRSSAASIEHHPSSVHVTTTSLASPETSASNAQKESHPETSLDDDSEYQIAESESGQVPESRRAAGPPEEINWKKFRPLTHEEFQKRRRETRSPLASLFQIVLGGLVAIPIALLIIWHGLGKDIAGAGPFVSRYVPWIVPAQFREDDLELPSPPKLSWKTESKKIESQTSDPKDAIAPSMSGKESTALSNATSRSAPAGGIGNLDKFDKIVQADSNPPIDKSSQEPAVDTESKEFHSDDASSASDSMSKSLEQWDNAIAAWQDYSEDNRDIKAQLAQSFYRAATTVATELSLLDPVLPSTRLWRDRASQLLERCAGDTTLASLMEAGGRRALSANPQKASGVALRIHVQSVIAGNGKNRILVSDEFQCNGLTIEFQDSHTKPIAEDQLGEYLILGILYPAGSDPSDAVGQPFIDILCQVRKNQP